MRLVDFYIFTHVLKQLYIGVVQKEIDGHIVLACRLQYVTENLHITERVHNYRQNLWWV